MKMKSFAMFVIGGVFVAFISCVAPVIADDTNYSYGQTVPNPSDNMQTPNNMNMPNNNNSNDMGSYSTTNTDEATPDTATGDDDY